MKLVRSSLIVGVWAVLASNATIAQDNYQFASKTPIAWDRLNDYDQVVQICRDLVAGYPDLLKMESIGKSVQGRDMWALTLNVEKTGAAESKPAMYIDANVHGNEVQGTETVLYTIWYLTKSYGKVPQLTELMDRTAFYFVPMINPDGRAYWFAQANTPHSSRGGQKPTDNDGDGLFDEDPPNDLDGDGNITQMRRLDPLGRWRENPDDPRIMVRVEPGARGEFRRYELLGNEGIDDDGDGDVNEDGPGGYDTNRNWPADWQPGFIQYGAGDFPLSLPESASVANFILARPNIAAVQSYHNSGGMLLRGPGVKYVEYPPADVRVYDRIGERGARMLPDYRYLVIWKDLYGVHGGFVNWTYEDLGIISFTNELWTARKYFGTDERPDRDDLMAFNDDLLFGQSFVDWHAVKHPLYGDIEVGGWTKTSSRVPPPFHLEEECHRNFAFTMFHAEQMPLLEFQNVETTALGPNLWRVRVDVVNRRSIPTVTAQAQKRRFGPRDSISINGDGRVVAGGEIKDRFLGPFEAVEHQPQRLWVNEGIPGDGLRGFQWIVSGAGPLTIRYDSPRAANIETRVEFK
ncbi:MAG: hypothetical protein KDA32_09370 [Phycisphaerales bacterium]|nr:hypothetical protein [Phycisphaerales bacterium]